MIEREGPAMSVILIGAAGLEPLRKTLRCLRGQTIGSRLEIVFVASSSADCTIDEAELEGLWGHRVVEIGPFLSSARARAAGVEQASAPLVAFGEDHCFPDPEWAESLVKAHEQPWAAVGPVMINANPQTAMSWADFLMGYSSWIDPTPAGPIQLL